MVKGYAGRAAVDGLSLALDRGKILALLGPNGAGKATTIEICAAPAWPTAARSGCSGSIGHAIQRRLHPYSESGQGRRHADERQTCR